MGETSTDTSSEPNFQSGMAQSSPMDIDSTLSSEDPGFAGNPMNSWFGWWPDDLVMMPIPSRSPELGWGLALAGGYFLDLDKKHPDTPRSTIGVVAGATENNSYFVGAGGKFNLADDDIRIKAAIGYLDINYRFFGIGSGAGDTGRSIDIQQQAPMFYVSATYQILNNTYLGLGFLGGTVDTAADLSGTPPPGSPALLDLDLNISGLEIPFQYDTRDDELYPRAGWLIDARTLIHREAIGADFDATSASLAINHYSTVRKRDVLALRFYTRATTDDTPFFLLSTFGGQTDLRGYERGRYRDNMMYAVQAEYRWQPLDRWIFTGFAGVGEVAPDYGSFFEDFLPAAGVGVRFVLSQKHKINVAIDIAAGKNGEEFYFSIGEAF